MEYSESLRRGEGWTEHELRSGQFAAAEPGAKLADTYNPLCKGRGELGEPAEERTASQDFGYDSRGRYAQLPQSTPGPNDADGWYRVLFDRPWLAPSLRRSEAERIFRRMADGLDDESYLHELRTLFCENRVDRLRMLGNGVYPESAAVAFMMLLVLMRKNMAHKEWEI